MAPFQQKQQDSTTNQPKKEEEEEEARFDVKVTESAEAFPHIPLHRQPCAEYKLLISFPFVFAEAEEEEEEGTEVQ